MNQPNREVIKYKLAPHSKTWAMELDAYYGDLLRKRYDFGFKLDTSPFDRSRYVSVVVSYYGEWRPTPAGWSEGWQRDRGGYWVAYIKKDLEGVLA